MNSFHPALVAMLAALSAASPAFGQSAETPLVNGHAVTQPTRCPSCRRNRPRAALRPPSSRCRLRRN